MFSLERFCNLLNELPYKYTIGICFFLSILISIFLNYIGLTISENAYYYTLSSIFQGLFSILALAGVFIIFKIEQLTRDIAEYDEHIQNYLQELEEYSDANLKFLPAEHYYNISSCLDEKKMDEYKQALYSLSEYFNKNVSSLIKKMAIGEEKDKKLLVFKYCEEIVKKLMWKGELIEINISLIFEITKRFKLPFMTGMPLIIFAIYFLPLLNSNSKFWFPIPITFIIGIAVTLTILVVLEIMCLILYSIWSKSAESTLYGLYSRK